MKKRLHDGSLKNSENIDREGFEYGVFLSFRGPDSRQGLADVLYSDMTTAGIRVFRDNDELEIGDRISKILVAVKNSKICVPIFSETFAASVWCLREVEAMVEHGKTIMPVFYTASPDDVKLRTELFKEDLRMHEAKHGSKQVKKWEDALKAVGKIIGREVKTTGYAEFSKMIVRSLLMKLMVKTKYVTDFLVKRNAQEEAVMELLDINSSDVRLVGVHGMGGVGKTTLVKVIFNALWAKFECSSFLENVQESVRCNGIEYLQKQLLEGLDPKLKHFKDIDPIELLRKKFRNRKVLIILDDVNERKQVEMIVGVVNCFGSGSRIIITTRDQRVLTKKARSFEVLAMKPSEALQLFSRHAFGADSPPSDYWILSNKVIELTGNLPLALEVIGSLLQGCEKKRWRATIEKLKKVPNRDVQGKLKLSFDALEPEHKQIFLDISCFFINDETSSANYMWEACDLFPDEGIEVLVSMSLLKLEENKFQMHDLIQDLGRALVREECADEPAKRSRIWSQAEALEVLKIKKGKENVEGLMLQEHGDENLTSKQFSTFRKLRLLKLVDMKLRGNFEHLLPKLKWFSWHRCSSDFTPTNVSLHNLVVLDIARSSINENWAGWSIIQMAKNLKVLDVTECCNLIRTPDLSNNTALERLILRGCRRLAYIHRSISKLKRLKHLDIQKCYSLRGLPEELASLEDLEVISVEGNDNIFHLPESIGKMRSLSVLKLHRVEIKRIPHSFGRLVNLVSLSMVHCTGLKKLPDALGDLTSLVDLDLSYTKLSALPNSVGRLAKLKSLKLMFTKLEAFPETVVDLKSLLRLDLYGSKIRVLPDSIGRLVKLESLDLTSTKLKGLPDALGDLTSLETLVLSRTELRVLPDAIGDLQSLVSLYLNSSKVQLLPDSIGRLVKLETLDLTSTKLEELPNTLGDLRSLQRLLMCDTELRVLPDAVGGLQSLVKLNLTRTKVSVLPNSVGRLSKLQHLYLRETEVKELPDTLGDISELTCLWLEDCKIRELPSCIRKLTKLERLSVGHPDFKTEIPKEIGSLSALTELSLIGSCIAKLAPSVDEVSLQDSTLLGLEDLRNSVRYLTLSHIKKEAISNLPDFSKLVNLESVEFRHCSLVNFDELESLREFPGIEIRLAYCSKELFDFVCGLGNMRELIIESHETLLDFPRLQYLRNLSLHSCDGLAEIRGLENLESLRTLTIWSCHSLETIRDVSELAALSDIYINDCPSLREIEGVDNRVDNHMELHISWSNS